MNVTQGRRWRIYRFSMEGLQEAFTVGNRLTIVDGIPDGAKIVRARYAPESDQLELIAEHNSFSVVGEGCVIPCADAVSIRRDEVKECHN